VTSILELGDHDIISSSYTVKCGKCGSTHHFENPRMLPIYVILKQAGWGGYGRRGRSATCPVCLIAFEKRERAEVEREAKAKAAWREYQRARREHEWTQAEEED